MAFSIIAESVGPGVISPSGIIPVPSGSSITFTMGPNPAKVFIDVLVDGVSVGAVDTYTFSNVSSNHTIEAQFSDDAPAEGLGIESIWDRTKSVLKPPTYTGLDKNPAPSAQTISLVWADAIVSAWKSGTTNIGHPCGGSPPSPHPAIVNPTGFVLQSMSSNALSMFSSGKYKQPLEKQWVVKPAAVPTPEGNMMRLTDLVFTSFISNLNLIVGIVAPDGCVPHIHRWELSSGLSLAMTSQVLLGIPAIFGFPPTPAIILLINAFTKALQDEIIEKGGTSFSFGAGHFHNLV